MTVLEVWEIANDDAVRMARASPCTPPRVRGISDETRIRIQDK